MAHRQSQPDQSAWPKYFLPRPGKEHAAREAQARIPATLMDLLYIQDPMTGAAQLVALLGCLGGHMLVVPDGAFTTLPDDLQRHIKTVEVDQRGIFRAIRARELYVLVLDAIDQDVAVQGFNDPVYLFSRMQAKIVTTAGSLQTAPLANEGRLAVGRLDMLHAYQQSLGCALANPLAPNEHTYQFLLPAAPRQEIEQGSGIVLIYPMLDPLTINSSDNSFIVMRLVYEVLARLQQDMVDEGIDHPFTRLAVPVPSRGRLESELMAEGYEIKGEYAIKQRQATGTQTGGFLSHLRQLAARWSEPRILLPDQARPEVYSDIIADLLATVSTPEDTAMAETLSRLVADCSPAGAPQPGSGAPSPAGSGALPSPQPINLPPAAPPERRHPVPASRERIDFAQDFQSLPKRSIGSSGQTKWWGDFGETAASFHLSTIDDWQQDAAFSSAGKITTKLIDPAPGGPPSQEWSQDFAGNPPAPGDPSTSSQAPGRARATPDPDWSNDFL